MRKFTPDVVTSLEPNQIFCFGSNSKGMHGSGAARVAWKQFGAIMGQAEGLQGQSYGIITKKDYKVNRSSTLPEIGKSIQDFLLFAKDHPEYEFLMTLIGTNLAGYSINDIKGLFVILKNWIPDNVILPKEFEVR